MKFRFSIQSLEEMARRGIERALVERGLAAPEQTVTERAGRRVRQSKVHFPEGEYLLRVIVDEREDPAVNKPSPLAH